MDELRARIQQRDAGGWNHVGDDEQDEAAGQAGKSENGVRLRTAGTICKDDEFMFRGANPRTGIVSPFVFGEGSVNVLWQEMAMTEVENYGRETTGRCIQGNKLGWNLANDDPLRSTMQRLGGGSSCVKPSVKKEHAEMSRCVRPKSSRMMKEKTQEYQSGSTYICRSRAQNIAANRSPIVSATRQMPVSPAILPTELQHIRRKKVGNGHIRKVSPINKEVGQYPSLGASATIISGRETSSFRSIEAGNAHRNHLLHRMIPFDGELQESAANRIIVTATAPSKTGSEDCGKYIQRLQLRQPSHVGRLTTSYRRPSQLLVIQPTDTQNEGEERNMGSTSSSCTLDQPYKSGQRPQVYRKFGTTSIPTMDSHQTDPDKKRQNLIFLAPQSKESILNHAMTACNAPSYFQNHNTHQRNAMSGTKGKTQSEELVSRIDPKR